MKAGQASLPQTTFVSFEHSQSSSNDPEGLKELQAALYRDVLIKTVAPCYQVSWGYWQSEELLVGVVDCMILKTGGEPVFQRGEFSVFSPSDLLVALNWRGDTISSEDLLNIFVEADACYDACGGLDHSQVRYGWVHPDGGKSSGKEIQMALNASGLSEITLENSTDTNPEIWFFEKREGRWYLSGTTKEGFSHSLSQEAEAADSTGSSSLNKKSTRPKAVTRDALGKTPLHLAAESGDVKTCKQILEEGTDPNRRDFSCNSPLHLAAAANQAECVRLLVDYGAECQAPNNKGKSSLHEAAENGSLEAAQVLIETGARADSLMYRKITPLHTASWNGHLGMVAFLVSVGADINYVNEDGNTCLHFAAGNGQIKIVKSLIQHGANPDLLNHRNLDYISVINEGYSGPPIPVM